MTMTLEILVYNQLMCLFAFSKSSLRVKVVRHGFLSSVENGLHWIISYGKWLDGWMDDDSRGSDFNGVAQVLYSGSFGSHITPRFLFCASQQCSGTTPRAGMAGQPHPHIREIRIPGHVRSPVGLLPADIL